MDITRCVVVAMGSVRMCEVLLTYLWKRKDKYNWILKRANQLNEENCFFFWWSGDVEFSNTPLRSFLKRMGDREMLLTMSFGERPFTVSRRKASYDIVGELPDGFLASNESYMCEDLATLLLGSLRDPIEEDDSADPPPSESVEVMEEGPSMDERINLIMKAVVHLLRKVDRLPTDMANLLGGTVPSDNPQPTHPYQQIPPQIPHTGGYLQMF